MQALLAAILARPDDDLPRLVYADWLEEAGELDRAEFIRLQCEHAARGLSGEQLARMNSLESAHRAEWIVPNLPARQEFQRGFVSLLHMAATDFLSVAESVGSLAPITSLRLIVANNLLTPVSQVSWISRLRSLDFSGNVGIMSRLRVFFSLRRFAELRSLHLRNCQLWPDSCEDLIAIMQATPKLETFDCSGNPISDGGLSILADGKNLPPIRRLILRCDELNAQDAIHSVGANVLANSALASSIEELNLSGHYLGHEGLSFLLNSARFAKLKLLDLSDNHLGNNSPEWMTIISLAASGPMARRPLLLKLCGHPDPNSGLRLVLNGSENSELSRWFRNGLVIDLRDSIIDHDVFERLQRSSFIASILVDPPEPETLSEF